MKAKAEAKRPGAVLCEAYPLCARPLGSGLGMRLGCRGVHLELGLKNPWCWSSSEAPLRLEKAVLTLRWGPPLGLGWARLYLGQK